jgi:hypothetical protein
MRCIYATLTGINKRENKKKGTQKKKKKNRERERAKAESERERGSTRQLFHLLHIVTTASQPYPPAHHHHRRAVAAAPPPEPAGASSSRTTLTQGSPETTTSVSTSASNNLPSLYRPSPSSPNFDRRPAATAGAPPSSDNPEAALAPKPLNDDLSHISSKLLQRHRRPLETTPSPSRHPPGSDAAGTRLTSIGLKPDIRDRDQVRPRNTYYQRLLRTHGHLGPAGARLRRRGAAAAGRDTVGFAPEETRG